jgi:hypothetical protein
VGELALSDLARKDWWWLAFVVSVPIEGVIEGNTFREIFGPLLRQL